MANQDETISTILKLQSFLTIFLNLFIASKKIWIKICLASIENANEMVKNYYSMFIFNFYSLVFQNYLNFIRRIL